MKLFKTVTLITVLFLLLFLNNVSAEQKVLEDMKSNPEQVQYSLPLDIEQKDSVKVDVLTEGSKEEAEKLTQKVLEDMKNHPEKVQFALPLDVK